MATPILTNREPTVGIEMGIVVLKLFDETAKSEQGLMERMAPSKARWLADILNRTADELDPQDNIK